MIFRINGKYNQHYGDVRGDVFYGTLFRRDKCAGKQTGSHKSFLPCQTMLENQPTVSSPSKDAGLRW